MISNSTILTSLSVGILINDLIWWRGPLSWRPSDPFSFCRTEFHCRTTTTSWTLYNFTYTFDVSGPPSAITNSSSTASSHEAGVQNYLAPKWPLPFIFTQNGWYGNWMGLHYYGQAERSRVYCTHRFSNMNDNHCNIPCAEWRHETIHAR